LEKNKQDIKCFQQRAAVAKAHNQYEIARKNLALLCGHHDEEFKNLSYAFYDLQPLPNLSILQEQLESSPEWSKSDLNCVAAAAVTRMEEKLRYPDLEVSAGVTSDDDEGIANAFFVEFAIPLPIFDRNHGNISKAYVKEVQAYYQKEQIQQELILSLQNSYSSWKHAYEMAKNCQEMAASAASESFKGIEEGYAQGKYEKSDLLEAKQAALEIQDNYLDALAEYHQKKAETLRIVGQLYRCENESEE
jgi:outer membrane protein, heavy metal efflux system